MIVSPVIESHVTSELGLLIINCQKTYIFSIVACTYQRLKNKNRSQPYQNKCRILFKAVFNFICQYCSWCRVVWCHVSLRTSFIIQIIIIVGPLRTAGIFSELKRNIFRTIILTHTRIQRGGRWSAPSSIFHGLV